MLFDVTTDPGEMRNAAAERPELVEECRAQMKAFLGELPYSRVTEPTSSSGPFTEVGRHRRWVEELEARR